MPATEKPEAEPLAESVLTPVPPQGGSFVWDDARGCPVPVPAPAAPEPAPEPAKGRAK
jgi:hypothetical protein